MYLPVPARRLDEHADCSSNRFRFYEECQKFKADILRKHDANLPAQRQEMFIKIPE
jgi:hypothetical protein